MMQLGLQGRGRPERYLNGPEDHGAAASSSFVPSDEGSQWRPSPSCLWLRLVRAKLPLLDSRQIVLAFDAVAQPKVAAADAVVPRTVVDAAALRTVADVVAADAAALRTVADVVAQHIAAVDVVARHVGAAVLRTAAVDVAAQRVGAAGLRTAAVDVPAQPDVAVDVAPLRTLVDVVSQHIAALRIVIALENIVASASGAA
mmetsp:Transcript_33236/g.69226  ORF Transcript_33236/g.69226 Transcript_33236/m.69226 type:complete len:201 (-) Transcript_33236:2114-2716(-)